MSEYHSSPGFCMGGQRPWVRPGVGCAAVAQRGGDSMGIIVIPHRQRFPYGIDVAVTGRVCRVKGGVTQCGIIVIPYRQRFPYGNDVATTGRVGRARASVCGRVGPFPEWPSGRSAARVSGREEACGASRTTIAIARASDSAASESRARAAAPVRPTPVVGCFRCGAARGAARAATERSVQRHAPQNDLQSIGEPHMAPYPPKYFPCAWPPARPRLNAM
jgi:hypothetical protein